MRFLASPLQYDAHDMKARRLPISLKNNFMLLILQPEFHWQNIQTTKLNLPPLATYFNTTLRTPAVPFSGQVHNTGDLNAL